MDLRIQRFADGPPRGLMSPINIFDFPEAGEPAIAYTETDIGIQEVTSTEHVACTASPSTELSTAPLSQMTRRSTSDNSHYRRSSSDD